MEFARDDFERELNTRPPFCLEYVKQHAEQGNAASVLAAIDAFTAKNFMPNVGPNKGEVMDVIIRDKKPRVMVELGAFTGYSAVRFAALQKEVAGPESHYYSFEYNPTFAAVVKEMVAFAGLANHVTIISGTFAANHAVLKDLAVDIYFIDHEKSCYLPDAQLILANGTLRPGALLAADNILMPGVPDYVEFIENHKQFTGKMHVVETHKDDGRVFRDAVLVAEFHG